MAADFNFDEIIHRHGTASIKYDAVQEFLGSGDVIPMWVADMDFRTPPFITAALRSRMEHELFAYSFRTKSYYDSITDWLRRRHNWNVPL